MFDASGGTLYFIDRLGNLNRFSIAGGALLTPILVDDVELMSFDITPNGQTAFVTAFDRINAPLHRVDLGTGALTTLNQVGESWTEDVVMMTNTYGFITSDVNGAGTGLSPPREVRDNPLTVSIRQNLNWWNERGRLIRSADRSRMLELETNSSGGRVRSYDLATDAFSFSFSANTSLSSLPAGLSRDGELFALGRDSPAVTHIYNRDFDLIASLPWCEGLCFDSARDKIYLADPISDNILVYRTTDWTLESMFPAGENVVSFQSGGRVGHMSISDDGNLLALTTETGIRIYNVPATGALGLFSIAGLASMRRRRR